MQALSLGQELSYELITTRERFYEAIAEITEYDQNNKNALKCLDVETYHALPKRYDDEIPRPIRTKKGLRGKAATIQVGLDPSIRDKQYIFHVLELNKGGVTDEEIGNLLRPLLEDQRVLGHQLQYEYQFMWRQFGIDLKRMQCTCLAAKVIWAGDDVVKFKLSHMYELVFGRPLFGWFIETTSMNYEQYKAFKEQNQVSDWTQALSEDQIKYSGQDVRLPFDLWRVMLEYLDEFVKTYGPKEGFHNGDIADEIQLEWDCIPAIAMMELRGFEMNEPGLRQAVKELDADMEEALAHVGKHFSRQVRKTNGLRGKKHEFWFETEPINLKSPKQIKEHVQKALGHPIENTEAETLEKYAHEHEAVDWIVKYKKAEHLHKNFGPKLLALIEDNGRIYTGFNQIGTATGRLSSSGAFNFQQIPGGPRFRTNFIAGTVEVGGQKLKAKLAIADFSQIQPRVQASETGDLVKEWCEAQDGELDLHAMTARDSLGLDYLPERGSLERDGVGKPMNLGMQFRMGFKKLALDILAKTKGKIDLTQNNFAKAKQIVEAYWASRPKTKRKIDELDRDIRARAEAAGTLAFAKGRKPLAVLWSKVGRPSRRCLTFQQEQMEDWVLQRSPNKFDWGEFERRLNKICSELWNHPIQSLEATITKRAILRIHNEMKNDPEFDYDEEGLIASVHDENIIRARESLIEKAGEILKRNMVEAGAELIWPIPCLVNMKICDDWYEGK